MSGFSQDTYIKCQSARDCVHWIKMFTFLNVRWELLITIVAV